MLRDTGAPRNRSPAIEQITAAMDRNCRKQLAIPRMGLSSNLKAQLAVLSLTDIGKNWLVYAHQSNN